jgi:hypothetical protein
MFGELVSGGNLRRRPTPDALDLTGSFQCRQDYDIAFVDAAEECVEGLAGRFTGTPDAGNGSGRSRPLSKRGSLFAFLERPGYCYEI